MFCETWQTIIIEIDITIAILNKNKTILILNAAAHHFFYPTVNWVKIYIKAQIIRYLRKYAQGLILLKFCCG